MKKHTAPLTALLLIALLALSACSIPNIGTQTENPAIELPQPAVIQQPRFDPQTEDALVGLYETVNQGVAAITIYNDGIPVGQGSGFLIDTDGHIVTNFHVVENGTEYEIAFPGGFQSRAELIGTDLDSDLAVIRAELIDQEILPLVLGDSSNVKVGQYVAAIGNPYGLSGTMTIGIVSARGRLLDSMRTAPGGGFFTAPDLIQTDAAINPGNSGGPLLNLAGEVIGVNRAIRTNEGNGGTLENSGIGFAVPINIVRQVVPFLIADGQYDYPYLGILSRESLTLTEKELLGFTADTNGAYIVGVPEEGPAFEAGLRGGEAANSEGFLPAGGDLIIAVDSVPVKSFSDLLAYMVTYKMPGDSMEVTVLRDGEELSVTVVLDGR